MKHFLVVKMQYLVFEKFVMKKIGNVTVRGYVMVLFLC